MEPTPPPVDPIVAARTPLEALLDLLKVCFLPESLSINYSFFFQDIFPDNLFGAAVDMNVLGLIAFSVAVGCILPRIGKAGRRN